MPLCIPVASSVVSMRVCLCVNARWRPALAHRQHPGLGPGWWLPSCRLQTPSGNTAGLPASRGPQHPGAVRPPISPLACASGHTFLLPGDTGQLWPRPPVDFCPSQCLRPPPHTIPAPSMVNPRPSLPFLGCLPDLGHPSSFPTFIASFIPLCHNFL